MRAYAPIRRLDPEMTDPLTWFEILSGEPHPAARVVHRPAVDYSPQQPALALGDGWPDSVAATGHTAEVGPGRLLTHKRRPKPPRTRHPLVEGAYYGAGIVLGGLTGAAIGALTAIWAGIW